MQASTYSRWTSCMGRRALSARSKVVARTYVQRHGYQQTLVQNEAMGTPPTLPTATSMPPLTLPASVNTQEVEEVLTLLEELRQQRQQQEQQQQLQSQTFQWRSLGPLPAQLIAKFRESQHMLQCVQLRVQELQAVQEAYGRPLMPEEYQRLQDPATFLQLQDMVLSEIRQYHKHSTMQLQVALKTHPLDSDAVLQQQARCQQAAELLNQATEEYSMLEHGLRQCRDHIAAVEEQLSWYREDYSSMLDGDVDKLQEVGQLSLHNEQP